MSARMRLILPFEVTDLYGTNTSRSDGTNGHEEQAFWSKVFTLEPSNKSSHERFSNQPHKPDTLLNPDAKCVHKKRKLDQNMDDLEIATALGLIIREKCGKNHLGDAFFERPKPLKQGHVKNHPKDLVTSSNYITSTELPIKEKPTTESSKTLETSVNEDFYNLSETSHSSSSENEDKGLDQTQNNSSSNDNHIPRPMIPIGPNFQAEIPKWEGKTYATHHNSDNDLKWLGIQLWPMPCVSENFNTKGIGEGRADSCSCKFPGSLDCVNLHISEARQLLKLETGTAFSSWRFDEMGEEVSKSWTLEEQDEFQSLIKLNPLSSDKNFWKLARKHFPSKSMKCMVNYYHNVYTPRNLRMETRSCNDVVDSYNDQDENLNKQSDYSSKGRSFCQFILNKESEFETGESSL
ncbi:hypothetical protein VNO78_15690 [Psophocarpus tetragonolobus]|uniref:Uncharacterized protein n=1 Tax=Psophocarpus tetragonolobus TaxID=3891 RepID=A0AAN9SF12_PSOTE